MSRIVELTHPLVRHHIVKLRDKDLPSSLFRSIVSRLTYLLAYEATQELKTASTIVQTPLAEATGEVLAERIGVVPILRAGLGMVEPVLDLIPDAEVWHLGFYRDEETHLPVEYYKKLPESSPVSSALVVDPMLATGGSAAAALAALKDWGVAQSSLLCIIAAPEGIEFIRSEHPGTDIYVCAIDERLDENAYIIPGLGDAGDRIFNT